MSSPLAGYSGNTDEEGEVQYNFLPLIDSVLEPQISTLIILVLPFPWINSEFTLRKLKKRTVKGNKVTLL